MQRFAPGDAVRTKDCDPARHTRLPRYLRGKRGTVESVHGIYALADDSALGLPNPAREALYTVSFQAGDIWGAESDGGYQISADLWDSYLERVAHGAKGDLS